MFNFSPFQYEAFGPNDYPVPSTQTISRDIVYQLFNQQKFLGTPIADLLPIEAILSIDVVDGQIIAGWQEGLKKAIEDHLREKKIPLRGVQTGESNSGHPYVFIVFNSGLHIQLTLTESGIVLSTRLYENNNCLLKKQWMKIPYQLESGLLHFNFYKEGSEECIDSDGSFHSDTGIVTPSGQVFHNIEACENPYIEGCFFSQFSDDPEGVQLDFGQRNIMQIAKEISQFPGLADNTNTFPSLFNLDLNIDAALWDINSIPELIEFFRLTPRDPKIYAKIMQRFGFIYYDADNETIDEPYSHPVDSLQKGYGVCTNYVVINYFWAYLHGYKPHVADIDIVNIYGESIPGHVLVWYIDENNQLVILNNQNAYVSEIKRGGVEEMVRSHMIRKIKKSETVKFNAYAFE